MRILDRRNKMVSFCNPVDVTRPSDTQSVKEFSIFYTIQLRLRYSEDPT
jgi:hypothetical protein